MIVVCVFRVQGYVRMKYSNIPPQSHDKLSLIKNISAGIHISPSIIF